MLDNLKSKLGFGGGEDSPRRADRHEDDYDEYGDDYGEYGDYGDYGDDYADGSDDGAGSHYDPYAPVTTRSAVRSGSRAAGSSLPKLVSIDDVRAHTQVPDSLSRDPLPARRVTAAHAPYRGDRTTVDSSLPYSLTPEGAAATAAAASKPLRSEGLNSLFEPTGDPAASQRSGSAAKASTSSSASGSSSGSAGRSAATGASSPSVASAAHTSLEGAFTAINAAHAAKPVSTSASRTCTVFKPVSYGEVERVAPVLKAGDAVVLCLRNTPDSLAKRILDFSFGVSSALDASVECVGDKVFAVTCGHALTDAERTALRNQGVL